jgi:hypothetical protein
VGRQLDPSSQPVDPLGRGGDPVGQLLDPRGRVLDPSGQQLDPSSEPLDPMGRGGDPAGRQHDPRGRAHRTKGRAVHPRGPRLDPRGRLLAPRGRGLHTHVTTAPSAGSSARPTTRTRHVHGPMRSTHGAEPFTVGVDRLTHRQTCFPRWVIRSPRRPERSTRRIHRMTLRANPSRRSLFISTRRVEHVGGEENRSTRAAIRFPPPPAGSPRRHDVWRPRISPSPSTSTSTSTSIVSGRPRCRDRGSRAHIDAPSWSLTVEKSARASASRGTK